ncbi:MAG TPA: CDP-glycerol glycerophosphotransferase family protein [Nocardioidaceae bacterium]|nr:CDP-glycerol glycerophosphotransferase family protein [Nocardioidaceae bacterium]
MLRARAQPAKMTVVVAAGAADATALDTCLDAMRAQAHRNLRVWVVPYGADAAASTRVREVARRHAAQDWRIRLAGDTHRAPDVAQARNIGARLAVSSPAPPRKGGDYLCFVDPRDHVPAGGLAALARALDESGSRFAIGAVQHSRGPFRNVAARRDAVHAQARRATTIAEFPLAVTDVHLESRLFRLDFWKAAGLTFEADQTLLALRAFAALGDGDSFDILDEVTYQQLRRDEGTPFGAQRNELDDLDGWLARQRQALELLEALGNDDLLQAWTFVVFDVTVQTFLDDTERATRAQWQALRDLLAPMRARIRDDAWRGLRAESRVKVWLTAADHRRELEEFVEARWFEQGNRATQVVDGEVRALLPFYRDPGAGVPDECYLMSEEETSLRVHLRGVRWSGHHVELDVYAFIDFVGYDDSPHRLDVALVDARGRRLECEVRPEVDNDANVVAGHRYQDYARGAAKVVVDARKLIALARSHDEPATEWRLEACVETRGLRRVGSITARDRRGTADMLGSGPLAPRSLGGVAGDDMVAGDDSVRVNLVPDTAYGVLFTLVPEQDVHLVESWFSGRTWHGRMDASDHLALKSLRVVGPRGVQVERPLRTDDGALVFDVPVPVHPDSHGEDPHVPNWTVRVVDRDGTEHPIAFPAGVDEHWRADGARPLGLARSGMGNCELIECARTAVITGVELEADRVVVHGRWLGPVPEVWDLLLHGRRARLGASKIAADGTRFEATVPLGRDDWGLGIAPVPTGLYPVRLVQEEQGVERACRVLTGQRVADQLLDFTLTDHFRMGVLRSGRGIAVRLGRPLGEDERGAFHQRRLQQWCLSEQHVDESAVYLQSYNGHSATDSPRAIHDELVRTRPDLTVYWGVRDHSTSVPPGGVPVLIESTQWFEVLGTARYLCNNIDFDRWFAKKPGQRVLQTFHGYPAKSMGLPLWRAKQFTPRRVDAEIRRTSRDWDLILTPCPEMDAYYRQAYRYQGEIESSGYPRDDTLLAGDADEVRRCTRKRLGVREDQTAVLYAPTWRDDLATSWRSAPMVRHLDLESASQGLGEDFVFLMRGHRFHAQGDERLPRSARLVDVTDYPEVNELILAADVAVLDYSSMRFDIALTGRPMLFLVPDLHAYTGGTRGFLYPFEDSAPGPLLDDAQEVVEALRDLRTVRERYADAYAAFNARFNYLQDGHAARRVTERFFR